MALKNLEKTGTLPFSNSYFLMHLVLSIEISKKYINHIFLHFGVFLKLWIVIQIPHHLQGPKQSFIIKIAMYSSLTNIRSFRGAIVKFYRKLWKQQKNVENSEMSHKYHLILQCLNSNQMFKQTILHVYCLNYVNVNQTK